MVGKNFEKWAPLGAAGIATLGTACAVVLGDVGLVHDAVPVGAMTFGIVAAGFAATQRNILLALGGSRVLKFFAGYGGQGDVMAYLGSGILAGLVVTVVSLVGLFLCKGKIAEDIWLPFFVGSIAWVIAITVRNEILMSRMVLDFMAEHKKKRTNAIREIQFPKDPTSDFKSGD